MRRIQACRQPFFNRLLLLILTSVLYFSCVTTKKAAYFRDMPDTTKFKVVEEAIYYTPSIQQDDILQVSIETLDADATAPLNQESPSVWQVNNTGIAAAPGRSNVTGYLVDREGYVLLPLIGKIMAKGQTTSQIRDDIRAKATAYYKDPVVNVRFANFKITVLGEVARPATYIMPNEKVTLLDALGVAGDLTIYGRRENVLLIRAKDGKKELIRFDLNNSEIFSSPYYYLQQGDVVYVEPNKAKIISTDATRLRFLTIGTALISLVSLIIARFY